MVYLKFRQCYVVYAQIQTYLSSVEAFEYVKTCNPGHWYAEYTAGGSLISDVTSSERSIRDVQDRADTP